jgi:cytochrome c-type protein NapC
MEEPGRVARGLPGSALVTHRIRTLLLAPALGAAFAAGPASAEPDWAKAPAREIVLFQPGQTSFEWAMTEKDHSGGPKMRKGKRCSACHKGEEEDIGADPGEGRSATLTAKVQLARDDERLYARVEWPATEPKGPKQDPDFEAKVTLLLDDGSVKPFSVSGCWAACHDDLHGMPSAAEGSELTKYLGASRAKLGRSGGGPDPKPQPDLDRMLAAGEFVEFWQAALDRSKPAVARDGIVLEKWRRSEEPAVAASATLANGKWVAVLSRKLRPGSPTHKDVVAGKTYTVGFAIHEGFGDELSHYVSLDRRFVLDAGKADWVVTR